MIAVLLQALLGFAGIGCRCVSPHDPVLGWRRFQPTKKNLRSRQEVSNSARQREWTSTTNPCRTGDSDQTPSRKWSPFLPSHGSGQLRHWEEYRVRGLELRPRDAPNTAT